MAKKVSVKATLQETGNVKTVWESNPSITLGKTGLNDFIAVYNATEGLDKDYAKKDVKLSAVREQRGDKARWFSSILETSLSRTEQTLQQENRHCRDIRDFRAASKGAAVLEYRELRTLVFGGTLARVRSDAIDRQEPEVIRSRQANPACPPLQPTHGGSVCCMDSPIHFVPRKTSSVDDVR
jgi:hypothetical protein